MSGFNTRVKLLEKWAPSLLPQLKDLDDLADIILDIWNEAEAHAEARIIKLLEDEWLRLEGKEWVTDDLISGLLKAIAFIKEEQE